VTDLQLLIKAHNEIAFLRTENKLLAAKLAARGADTVDVETALQARIAILSAPPAAETEQANGD
jgi:hypothetical protein